MQEQEIDSDICSHVFDKVAFMWHDESNVFFPADVDEPDHIVKRTLKMFNAASKRKKPIIRVRLLEKIDKTDQLWSTRGSRDVWILYFIGTEGEILTKLTKALALVR